MRAWISLIAAGVLFASLSARGADDFAPLDASNTSAPAAAEPAPAGADTTPVVTDTTPTAPETTPALETTPAATDTGPAPSRLKTSYEVDVDADYVGGARTNFGAGETGEVSEQSTSGRLLIEPEYDDGPIYRFGLGYQRYNFGLSKAAPLPDILEAENLVAGVDFNVESWLIRVEADPGLYGDGRSTGFRDFNVPFELGGSYIASDSVQWIVGLGIDFDRQFPVIPSVGIHWSVTDNWVIDGVLPTPRVEYDYNSDLTLYLGGDFDDGTYRVDRGLGDALGRRRLGNAIVEYDEIHVGGGLSWKASKAITLELEGGYLPYREFDFHRADTHYSNDDGAPYGRMSFNAQF